MAMAKKQLKKFLKTKPLALTSYYWVALYKARESSLR